MTNRRTLQTRFLWANGGCLCGPRATPHSPLNVPSISPLICLINVAIAYATRRARLPGELAENGPRNLSLSGMAICTHRQGPSRYVCSVIPAYLQAADAVFRFVAPTAEPVFRMNADCDAGHSPKQEQVACFEKKFPELDGRGKGTIYSQVRPG